MSMNARGEPRSDSYAARRTRRRAPRSISTGIPAGGGPERSQSVLGEEWAQIPAGKLGEGHQRGSLSSRNASLPQSARLERMNLGNPPVSKSPAARPGKAWSIAGLGCDRLGSGDGLRAARSALLDETSSHRLRRRRRHPDAAVLVRRMKPAGLWQPLDAGAYESRKRDDRVGRTPRA